MRVKVTKTEVYSFDELSEKAKENAHNEFLNEEHYFWGDDNQKTLDAFCAVFPITAKDWEYGYRNYISGSMPTADSDTEKAYYDFTGIRLLKYIVNNYWHYLFKRKFIGSLKNKEKFTPIYSRCQCESCCVLTGYCIDDAILQPIYDFLKKPDKTSTFEDILKDCLESWIIACNKDYEDSCSQEYFTEHAEANNYEFTEDGKLA